jgi:aryl sulfotransferase
VQTHRRFIKTHLPVDALVFSRRARYSYIGRDGRDGSWSMDNHAANTAQEFRDQLNRLPGVDRPPATPPPSDIREFWRGFLDCESPGGQSIWDNVRGSWAIRNLPHVRLVHYANLKRDLPGELRRIAAFLEIPIDESRWDAILEYCSFDWMKANAAKVVLVGGVAERWRDFHSSRRERTLVQDAHSRGDRGV